MKKTVQSACEKYYVEIYLREEQERGKYPNHLAACKFKQRTPKAKWVAEKYLKHHVYYTWEDAEVAALTFIQNINRNALAKKEARDQAKKRNAATSAADHFKVGDIVYNTWGYEQTNVEFYQVTEVLPKSIKVKEIYQVEEKDSMYSHGMACNVLPAIDKFIEDGPQYLLRVKADGILSAPRSFYYFTKWNGGSRYKSWYA